MQQSIRAGCLFVFIVLASAADFGQASDSLLPLRITDERPISSFHLDANGFREVSGNEKFYIEAALGKYVAIDLNGETHQALDLASVPATDAMSPKDLYLVDLSPGPHGGVLAAVVRNETPTKTRSGLVRFDGDGRYVGLIWLDASFTPTHAAEFSSSGSFLVTGYDEHAKIKVALFDFRGFLLKPQVVAYGDKENTSSNGVAEQSDRQAQDDRAMREAGMIQMASAEDDSVYLYNAEWGRKVIRVQSNGKTTEMSLADSHSSTMPLQMTITGGYLYLEEAILHEGEKRETATALERFSISVYDRYDGTLKASYEVKGAAGVGFIAASPRDFYFLGTKVPPGGAVNFSLVREQP